MKRKSTLRFFISLTLCVALFATLLVYKREYVTFRNAVRTRVLSAMDDLGSGLRSSGASIDWSDGIGLSANFSPMRGVGELINSAGLGTPQNTGEGLTFDETFYPYRAMLRGPLQENYNQVYRNAELLTQGSITLVNPITENELHDVMSAVYNDHPELFWLDTAYSYGYLPNGNIVSVTLAYNDTINRLDACSAAFDAAINSLVETARAAESDVEKEKIVHDYLMENVVYDEQSMMNQSAYSALVNGASVCAGYSRAFQLALMRMSIPCYYATGVAAEGDHAWNIVRLNGECYNVDTSWDDALGTAYEQLNYTYFNVTDAEFADHQRGELSMSLPACTATQMSFRSVYGELPGSGSFSAQAEAPTGKTYADLGYTANDVIGSMDAYNAYCRDKLMALGAGEHSFELVVGSVSLVKQIFEAAQNGEYVNDYAQSAVNAMRLKNCTIQLHLSARTLADGTVLLTQTYTLSGDVSNPVITPAPTPTLTPTPAPTAVPTETPAPTDTSAPTETPAQEQPTPEQGTASPVVPGPDAPPASGRPDGAQHENGAPPDGEEQTGDIV